VRKWLLLFLILWTSPALAKEKYQGWCEQGNNTVTVSGLTSSTTVQRSYPTCTITVYLTGTVTVATLYSDNAGTVLGNPFANQSTSTGQFYFFADLGYYDIQISATNLTTFTLSNVGLGGMGGVFLNCNNYSSATNCLGGLTGSAGIAAAPYGFTAGAPASIGSAETFWDFRDNGRLQIRTNPSAVEAGSSAGISVVVGAPTSSATNPPVGAPVAGYFALDTTNLNASSGGTAGVTGLNADVNIPNLASDAYAVSIEGDINNTNGSQQPVLNGGTGKYSFRASYGGNKQVTAAYSIDGNPTAAGTYHGFGCANAACISDIMSVAPNFATWTLSENVTGSGSPQSIFTNYNTVNQNGIRIGAVIAIDTGGSQENVNVLNIVTSGMSAGGNTCSTTNACVNGTFVNNHTSGAAMWPYTTVFGIDFTNAVFSGASVLMVNLQNWNASHSGIFQGEAIRDAAGALRTTRYWNGSALTVFREVAGQGFRWEKQDGTLAATLSPAGVTVLQGSITAPTYLTSGNCGSAASPAVCAAAAAGHVALAAGATTLVVDTTAVTVSSSIQLTRDDSVGSLLAVTCNTQGTLTLGTPRVTARTAGTSFTITVDVGPTTNPMCIGYTIMN
jgi:hypothetical protein